MTGPWYLLYGGSSEDGCGPGKYVGRTVDVFVAAKHYIKISKNPYSTGYVKVVTDDETVLYSSTGVYTPTTSVLKEAIAWQRQEYSP